MSNEKTFQTRSGITIKESYTAADVPADLSKRLSSAGSFPFTRGVQKTMYRGRHWTMRQYAGFGTVEESNARYLYLLSQGTTGLSVAFDLPTQLGYDPDHARSKGEVGKVGVSVSNIEDMRRLFQGIKLDQVSTSMTINATAAILLSLYVCVAEEQGVDTRELRGTIQNDVLKEYIARGNFIYPPKGALRLITDIFTWCESHTPKFNPISISGYHIREAGSTAVQELAFTFANAIAYVDAAIKSGLDIDQFAGQLSFFFNVHSDFFEEIAKFRAARSIWAKIVRDRYKAKDPRSMMLRFHSQTAGSTLTAQQPDNNVVRVTAQAMSAILGGTQSLHTNSLDEALALPTESSARLALRTQQVLAYETKITDTVDPLAGSFYVESLTADIEARVFKYLEDIDRLGGTVQCIETGYIQNEILNSAYKDQRAIDSGEIKIVGVNCFQDTVPAPKRDLLHVSPAGEKKAVEKIRSFKERRNSVASKAALAALGAGARGQENLMQLIYQAVKAECTLGEISDELRSVFGEYKEYAGF